MKIHVLIPLYKRYDYFKRCVQSIKLQPRDQTSVIVFSDGESPNYVKSLCKDNKIEYIERKEHRGIAETLSDVLEYSLKKEPVGAQVLIASDHACPSGFFPACKRMSEKVIGKCSLGKIQTSPTPAYFKQGEVARRSQSIGGNYKISVVRDLRCICSMPSIVFNPTASQELIKFLRECKVSGIEGVNIGRLYLTFWSLWYDSHPHDMLSVLTGRGVNHMCDVHPSRGMNSKDIVSYFAETGRAGQKVKTIGDFELQYTKKVFRKRELHPAWISARKWVVESSKNAKKILDLGCGEASLCESLKRYSYRGVDFCWVAVNIARGRHSKGVFQVGDINHPLFYQDEDTVLLVDLLDYVESEDRVLSLIRPGTKVIACSSNDKVRTKARVYSSIQQFQKVFSRRVKVEEVRAFSKNGMSVFCLRGSRLS